MTTRFDHFVDALARVKVSDRAHNQYRSAIRRENLRLYLEQIVEPRMLLVGEAPSYRGGRLTGIAFTSEQIMLCGVDGRFLGQDRGFRKATPGPKRSTEASATMVWATIKTIEPLPLLWNAFPFHPFDRGNPFSNRLPTAAELLIGAPILETLLEYFPIDCIVAVGNLAERSLARLGIPHTKVRHPSQGGKRKFVEGVLRLAADA
ncbi:MAG TPA: uracil-DNA glycosylase [Thermoanaerobaculia bacterium]|nr:uracil-DNA glycosylase [Thermoanaerobaculia bacterium]